MLTLVLLRHAKAEPVGRGDDFERALTGKGRADAKRLGAYLGQAGHVPALAIVSAATRTVQTLDGVSRGIRTAIPAHIEDKLYNATSTQVRGVMDGVEASTGCLMIVGHNPGIMDAAMALVQEGDPADIGRLRDRFPPCSAAIVTFACDTWRDASANGGRLDALILPEDLPG